MINIYGNDKNNGHLIVGELYDIQTKKGIVKKYLSFVDNWTKTLYFLESKGKIRKGKYGTWMQNSYGGAFGTAHSTKNVIGLSKWTLK